MPKVFIKVNKHIFYLLQLIILCALYTMTGILGLRLHPVGGFATLVWLPSGISLAFFILWGYRLFPAVFFGALLVNIITGAPLPVALGIAIGNTLEPLLAHAVLSRWKFDHALGRLKDVVGLIFLATPLGSIVSATLGTGSLFIGGLIPLHSFYTTWQAWLVGDLISMVIITPLIITWFSHEPYHFFVRPKGLEALLLLGVTTLIGFTVFHGKLRGIFAGSPRTYLVFPLLMWASLRFGSRATATCVLVLSFGAITGILQKIGPFSGLPIARGLLSLQIFMGVLAVSSLILASIDTERKAYAKRKDEFIGLVAHELKTPLTSLKLYAQSLTQSMAKTPQVKETIQLEKMSDEINRLNALISDLLDISTIRLGSLAMSKEKIDLLPFIQKIIDAMQPTTKHPIILKTAKKNQNPTIYADLERLRQVFVNLITNAIKYSPDQKPILISIAYDKSFLLIRIKDYGVGISQEDAKRIFDKYYRAPHESNLTYPGLGLGLYVSHEIIKQHKGNIWVESKKGKGATFYVRMPLVSGTTTRFSWQKGFVHWRFG